MRRLHRPKWTLRVRLTALYATVFLLGAAVLLLVTASLVDRGLGRAYQSGAAAERLKSELNDLFPTASPGAATSGKPAADDAAALKKRLLKANADVNQSVQAGAVRSLMNDSLLTLGVLVPVTALVGWLLAGRALRPVAAITNSARRASETRLSDRLSLRGPRDEITELADTFDAMLDRLEHAFEAQRRFTANVSHELRTPLTVARTSIEVVLAKPQRTAEQLVEMASDVHAALDRADILVDSLLTLARSQHLAHGSEDVDLAAVAEDAVDARAAHALERGITIRTSLDPAPATGDRALLDHLAVNLVDNAVRHNPDGGSVDLRTGRDGHAAFLRVSNTGPHIDPADLPRLFEPFQSADGPARADLSGLGLGLSIVRSVADAHNAKMATAVNPGGGLTITVTFPTSGGT